MSRGVGRSAVAASAYMSCSQIVNDYDGVRHDYTRKKGLVWSAVFLPTNAPPEWQDRSILWNTVEESEKTKDSRLAREFVVALPVELDREAQKKLLTDFIREQFVAEGMCADVALHDTDGHNPHAHILLTVRPLDENGHWQYKTEKEYLCVRSGEERGFTAKEFKEAQRAGWEKQYPYYIDKKKKVYLPPSQADGLERADKHPKSTKYGRQNPIAARWNSEEQLVLWRKAWADTTNKYLELTGTDARIDHRSNAERGIDELPTIHEGVTARALEKKGIVSDRCEINRQIRAENELLRELKAKIQKLTEAVKNSVPALAEAMEKLRENMIILRYQLRYIAVGKQKLERNIKGHRSALEQYSALVQKIKSKVKERKRLQAEKDAIPFYQMQKHHDLAVYITELTEDIEELKSEKAMLFKDMDVAARKKDETRMEDNLQKLSEQAVKLAGEMDNTLEQYRKLEAQSAEVDSVELQNARRAIHTEHEQHTASRLKEAYGERYSPIMRMESEQDVDRLIRADIRERSEKLHEKQAER